MRPSSTIEIRKVSELAKINKMGVQRSRKDMGESSGRDQKKYNT
jgi:hypothetical protein